LVLKTGIFILPTDGTVASKHAAEALLLFVLFKAVNFIGLSKASKSIAGLDRPYEFQEVETQISRQSANEGGKIVSTTNRPPLPPLPPGKYSWYSFLLEA